MHERMLNRQVMPTAAEMAACCGDNAARFSALNRWLADTFGTEQSVVFPYGNHYGWCIAHRKKRTLFCNVFPEVQALLAANRADAFWSHPSEHSPRCQTAATARCLPARQVRSILVMR